MSLVSEQELVKQFKSKDSKAFTYLYDAYAPALLGSIQRMIPCAATSEDVLQNVFIKIWSSSAQYEPKKGRLFTWMINITRNTTIDYIRQQKVHPQYYRTQVLADGLQKTCMLNKHISKMDATLLLKRLMPRKRGLLQLVLAGFTCKEIGKLLHIPESTVKSRMQSAYKKCRLFMPTS
jgi:RNA polymerase sigma-70 factor (ECF subfamily)